MIQINVNRRIVSRIMIFIFLITVISYMTLWRSLSFDFWRDDWGQLWAAVYKPSLILTEWAVIRLHPGSAWEQFLGAKVFGLNPSGWQTFGLLLKIFDSIVISLMVFAMTKSRKHALLAGVFFACLLVGVESFVWVSAHTSALFLFFFCLGLCFWFDSEEKRLTDKKSILALILVPLSALISPGRGISVLFLIPFWSFLSIVRLKNKEVNKRIAMRTTILVVFLLLLLSRFNTGMVSVESLVQKWQLILKDSSIIKNFLGSVGNLFIGWIKPISEVGSLTNISKASYYAGAFLVVLLMIAFLLFFLKRAKPLQMIAFSLVWILVFYLPNWLFDQTLVVGTSHRYLAISSVGLVLFMTVLIGFFRLRYTFFLAIIFIAINIKSSNVVLASQAEFRSRDIVEAIWDKIDKDVPKDEMDSIFMYGGGDYLRGVALDWSASVPFGIKREMKNVDDFPIVTGDNDLIVSLLCKSNIERPSLGKWSVQKSRIPISHLHAWELNGGQLKNISEEKRSYFKQHSFCELLP